MNFPFKKGDIISSKKLSNDVEIEINNIELKKSDLEKLVKKENIFFCIKCWYL